MVSNHIVVSSKHHSIGTTPDPFQLAAIHPCAQAYKDIFIVIDAIDQYWVGERGQDFTDCCPISDDTMKCS